MKPKSSGTRIGHEHTRYEESLAMPQQVNCTRTRSVLTAGALGFVSGLLSSATIPLHAPEIGLSVARWLPGLLFAVVVLLQLSRSAGDGWLRTAGATASCTAIYPVVVELATESAINHSAGFMLAAFAVSGFLGATVLAGTFLVGRFAWLTSGALTVSLGTLIGLLSGASFLVPSAPLFLEFRLGVILTVWQTVIGFSLGWGLTDSCSSASRPTRIGLSSLETNRTSSSVGSSR